eukprot:jgi/Tetstr1/447154/TSEL_034591.t1
MPPPRASEVGAYSGRQATSRGAVFTSALHLSFLRGTTELKELEGGLEHAKAALKDAKATRKAKANKARMLEVDVKAATKKLKVQAKRVEDCLAAGFHRHSRHLFINLSLRRTINRLLVTAYLAGPDALRAARRCRSILARAAAKSANRTFSTMGACDSWLLEGRCS